MQIDDIIERLEKVRQSGQGWVARCPAHDDRNPSLSLKVTETGRLLMYCHAGCSFDDILQAMDLERNIHRASLPLNQCNGQALEQIEAQQKAIRIWESSKSAHPDHPYLTRKKIRPHHSRLIGESLILPLQDPSGNLRNLQFISKDGTKRFLKGGQMKSLFCVIGEPAREPGRVYVAEGFATGATIHEQTGDPVFVAYCDTNLPPVARTVRRVFPSSEIIIAVDDDEGGEHYSNLAARQVDGLVAYARKAGRSA